ncbi:hypothetical protein E1263_29970 [Kribbella antibiotica]|uniref:Guanylate cyclase domain-containing protein n=1 Tax=Kribbella antibiotica TaxID=190195 RepID=A0A4R4Z118_9ACTN|nr:hypothetical protein [Kribbella antibiotica]TDD51611.1 hypothetical protein E1263_29970 [Kribbella antibiotica]
MTTPHDPRSVGVRDLPPYRSMLVVDMKDYSGTTSRDQAHLNVLIPEILESAFTRGGLTSVWSEISFRDSTGDGYAIGLPAERLPFLLNPLLGALQDELAERGRPLSAAGFPAIRMRVSVSIGPVTDSGENGVGDGAGAARVELHRLLDSKPVRHLLTNSAEVTKVAAIVSARAYDDAVVGGYSQEDSSLYVEVAAEVKTYQGRAYLRVPVPSGDLLKRGFGSESPTVAEEQANKRAAVTPAPATNQANDHSQNRRGGIGSISGTVHSIITDPTAPVHTGQGHLYLSNEPDSKEHR